MKTIAGKPSKPLANHEIVTLAVYLAGGDTRFADTEDVAIKANDIAPGRFTWHKYREQINIDTVRKRLWDATKPGKGCYLVGSEKKGWLLTEMGLKFAKAKLSVLKTFDLSGERLSLKEKQRLRGEKVRMLACDAFAKFQQGGLGAVTTQDAEAFFRIDDYVPSKAREQKIMRSHSHPKWIGTATISTRQTQLLISAKR